MKINLLLKLLIIVIGVLFFFYEAEAQKKLIDTASAKNWPHLNPVAISNNGKYVCYNTETGGKKIYTVQESYGKWKMDFREISDPSFVGNKHFIFRTKGDSLGILNLDRPAMSYFPGTKDIKSPKEGTSRWLAYRTAEQWNLYDLDSNQNKSYPGIDQFVFNKTGTILLTQSKANDNFILNWVDLVTGKEHLVSRGDKASDFAFDNNSKQLTFLTAGKTSYSLKYYQSGMDSAITKISDSSPAMQGFTIKNGAYAQIGQSELFTNFPSFSEDGKKLIFSVKRVTPIEPTIHGKEKSDFFIWSYKDALLREDGGDRNSHQNKEFLEVLNLETNKTTRFDAAVVTFFDRNLNFASTLAGGQDGVYTNLNRNARPDLALTNLNTGKEYSVVRQIHSQYVRFSPGGKYVLWFDTKQRHYFTYNTTTHTVKNISLRIKFGLYNKYEDSPSEKSFAKTPAGWLPDDKAVLIYDQFDIWKIDPEGVKNPINLTEGFGKKRKVSLTAILPQQYNYGTSILPESLSLYGLNEDSKENSFYNLSTSRAGKLIRFPVDGLVHYFEVSGGILNISDLSRPFFPLKARDTDEYLVSGMSAVEFPNLYITDGFKKFHQLTDLAPQREYNWLSSELLHWKMFDGKLGTGILYKPENFDTKKRYPILFYYYERHSDAVNMFLNPELTRGIINVPEYVSNGYLVFVPDIDCIKTGAPGVAFYNAVGSAGQYFAKKPWVNGKKMGIQGHSFGGFGTNYILTKTKIFAAAASGAGRSNSATNYSDNADKQPYFEKGQGRMGVSLWESKKAYIDNSPYFYADKVSTPLFIMHNMKDGAVLWTQGMEWFNALRYLRKKVWLIQYNNGIHTLVNASDQLDFDVRLRQFFDHYLKDAPAPLWMTKTGGEKYQGKNGLDMDSVNVKP